MSCMGPKHKTNPVSHPLSHRGLVLVALIAGAVYLGVSGSILEPAAASQHREPHTYQLGRCRVEDRQLPSGSSIHALITAARFYVCRQASQGPSVIGPLNFCIPFVSGASKYSADYNVGEPSISASSNHFRFDQEVPARRRGFTNLSGSSVDCSDLEGYISFAIVCLHRVQSLSPHADGPLNPDSLNGCQLEAILEDPSFPPAPAVNWGRSQPAGLTPGESYLVLIDLTNCRQPASDPNYRACQLPTITSTSGTRYSNLDFCWIHFIYDDNLNYPELLESPPLDIGWVENRPWDANGPGFHPVTGSGVDGANCTGLRPDHNPPAVIRYYRFTAFDVRCTIDPSNSSGTSVSLNAMSNDCLLAGLAWMPDETNNPGGQTEDCGQPGQSECPVGFEAHICHGSACGFLGVVDSFLRWLSYLVVPLVIIMIIYGGISLSLAGDNPEATRKAKSRITQAIIALVCFALLWSFLKWLIA